MTTKELKAKLINSVEIDESDIDWIICEVAGVRRSEICLPVSLSDEQVDCIYNLIARREAGRPLAYILGKSNFYGRDFIVREGCLIPRCETEELVECILTEVSCGEGLEIGVGSGAISITLALESKNIKMLGVDISDDALAITNDNINKFNANVRTVKSDLFSEIKSQKFDFIVSNPPYIKSEEVETLMEEVKNFEPKLALDGGIDGLDFYRAIIKESPRYLKQKGKIFFEVGVGEAEDVKSLLEENFEDIVIKKDLEGVERIVFATLKEKEII